MPLPSSQRARSALVAAGLGACLVGLAGADAGIVWIVAGVWTIRSVWRSPPSYAWGLLCLGTGARWGTLGVADVEAASRIFGTATAAGSAVARTGMFVAVAAAVLSEARIDGLRAAAWMPRVAAFAAALALVPLALAPGPGDPGLEQSLLWWAVGGIALVAAILGLARLARRVPSWIPAALAVAGVAAALLAS